MRISTLSLPALCVCAAFVMVTGCNSGAFQSTGSSLAGLNTDQLRPNMLDRPSNLVAGVKPATPHPDHHKSWVSPDIARAPRLLFVSDFVNSDIYIYSMPLLRLKGTLTGFGGPQGECSDAQGNVWVTNTSFAQILKLSRTGSIENTLKDTSGYPIDCAIDPTTGNLAVTNIVDAGSAPGAVVIYPNASGTPTSYTNPNQRNYYFAGYDPSGNLFFDGKDSSGNFILSELPKGSSSARTVNVSGGTIYFPGMVQWYPAGNYLAVGDQNCGDAVASCVYWVSVSGTAGTITGTTNLSSSSGGTICDMIQGVILPQTKNIAGSDLGGCSSAPSTTYRWAFPAGGGSNNLYANPDYAYPDGAAISNKNPQT
jgi:hypothetical protein